MAVDWNAIYNLLFKIIDQPGDAHYSGPRFIRHVQEIDPAFPDYNDYLRVRNDRNESTTRKHYFNDILFSLPEHQRFKLFSNILVEVGQFNADFTQRIKTLMGGDVVAPSASIPADVWNTERLNSMLANGQVDRRPEIRSDAYNCSQLPRRFSQGLCEGQTATRDASQGHPRFSEGC